jgi:hypothetical protein
VELPPLYYINKDRGTEVTMDPGTISDQQQASLKMAGGLASSA